MKAMFANLTTADFRGRSRREWRAAERKRVHALFDLIQVAIHARDRATVEDLMAELAIATTGEDPKREDTPGPAFAEVAPVDDARERHAYDRAETRADHTVGSDSSARFAMARCRGSSNRN